MCQSCLWCLWGYGEQAFKEFDEIFYIVKPNTILSCQHEWILNYSLIKETWKISYKTGGKIEYKYNFLRALAALWGMTY